MEKMRNICFVYDCEYPWDIRVEKICNSLAKICDTIHLVCRNKNNRDRSETLTELHIHRLPKFRTALRRNLSNSTFFFNPYWISEIFRVAKENQCMVIIVRDLPLALAGILVGRRLGIPVVVDMAEPYPLTLRQRLRFEPLRPYHLVTRNVVLAEILEHLVIRYSHHILVVCEEARSRLMRKGCKDSKITIIRNTPRIDSARLRGVYIPSDTAAIKDKFIIMYVGLLIGGRGIELTLQALKKIEKAYQKLSLVIIGAGKKEYQLRSIAQKLGVDDVVTFKGWIEHDKVHDYISACDLGILPFRGTEHMHHTVANKLFDFWAQAKPVLCSDVAPMKRLIKETGAGYLFKADCEQSLADAIQDCMRDPDIREKGERGRDFVMKKYNWSMEETKLLRLINREWPSSRGGKVCSDRNIVSCKSWFWQEYCNTRKVRTPN